MKFVRDWHIPLIAVAFIAVTTSYARKQVDLTAYLGAIGLLLTGGVASHRARRRKRKRINATKGPS